MLMKRLKGQADRQQVAYLPFSVFYDVCIDWM